MLKKCQLFLFVFLLSCVAAAEFKSLRLGPGKVIAYQHVVNNPEGPTLILLPGVNRALYWGDDSVRALSSQGWNLLMPSLTSHPRSIQFLGKSEVPYFLFDKSIRVKDFANDIEELVESLKINKAIPVSLSYSSSVAAYLNPKKFPHVIETVPLGIATEANPEAAKNAELWEGWLRMNPFMAPFWIRESRDAAYSMHWGKTVDANLKSDPTFYGDNPRVNDIKSGYVTIARAVEDFNFSKWDFNSENRTRDFVFGERENPERLKNQIEVLKNYIASGKPVRVVVVAKAGHVLPSDRPSVYSGVVSLLASQSRKGNIQFAFVDSADGLATLNWKDQSALKQWIQENSR